MIVIIPKMILDVILDHAGSHPDREVIGALLGKSIGNGRVIEITDIVSYPEASHPEKAVLPGTFLYNRIGDEIRERNYSVNVKGYYHSHPPDVFPLKFSQIDYKQYEELQNVFARKQPFLAVIVDPVNKKYEFLTLDIDKREIHLEPFAYGNLIWVDYAVKRFSDGFSPYRIDPQTGEGIVHPEFQSFLDNLSQKYKQKKVVNVMFSNALRYRENMEKYADELGDTHDLLEMFQEAKVLYFDENFIKADSLLEQFIKTYVETVSEKIDELEERGREAVTESSPSVVRLNQKIHNMVKGMETEFSHDAAKIAGIILDIKQKIDDLGEPFFYIGIDKGMKLQIPSKTFITEDHLKYVENIIDEQIIEHLGHDYLEKMEKQLEFKVLDADRVHFINQLLSAYFQLHHDGTADELNDTINQALISKYIEKIYKYIKEDYSIKELFFENLKLVEGSLKDVFKEDFQRVLLDVESFLKEEIQKTIGTEKFQELLDRLERV